MTAMRFTSTRGGAGAAHFADAMLRGLAPDGGLYMPDDWPAWSARDFAEVRGAPYVDTAAKVVATLTGNAFPPAELQRMVEGAYGAFRHACVAPLVQVDDNLFVLELFHGPTLAFKDVAMRLLARMIDHTLTAGGERATIAGATSGDTGSAAIDAFGGLDRIDLFTLFPLGRVSEVQRRQMTTPRFTNSWAMAVEGTFDDCQALVKAMLGHADFRDRTRLLAVNSINWGRIAAQAVYYVTAAAALCGFARPVSFAVPTGNFGDVFAGYAAKRLGVPIDRLIVATNRNDILARTLETGAYEVRQVVPTSSPSMDIQVSSNFERLLFDASGRDARFVRDAMTRLSTEGRFVLPDPVLAAIRAEFDAFAADEPATDREMARVRRDSGYLADPHTATALAAARRRLAEAPGTPVIVLATAAPAKFPDAVEAATGIRPALPAHLADLHARDERMDVLPNRLDKVEAYILDRGRMARAGRAGEHD